MQSALCSLPFFLPLAQHHSPGLFLISPDSPVSFVGSSPFQYWFSIFGPVLFLAFLGWLSNLWFQLSPKLLLNPYLQVIFHTGNLAIHISKWLSSFGCLKYKRLNLDSTTLDPGPPCSSLVCVTLPNSVHPAVCSYLLPVSPWFLWVLPPDSLPSPPSSPSVLACTLAISHADLFSHRHTRLHTDIAVTFFISRLPSSATFQLHGQRYCLLPQFMAEIQKLKSFLLS